jgi:hypothetical protein
MSARILAVIAFAALVLAPAQISRPQTSTSACACPVTPPPQPAFTPTGVTPLAERRSFYFGTPNLSLLLSRPWYQRMNKIPWFSDAIKYPGPVDLKVTSRRLDGDAPPAEFRGLNVTRTIDIAGNPAYDVMTASMRFPTAGCWEITAQMNETKLTFVTDVQPGEQRQEEGILKR